MKITAVFLSKKKHNDSKWLVDKIKAQNKKNENNRPVYCIMRVID